MAGRATPSTLCLGIAQQAGANIRSRRPHQRPGFARVLSTPVSTDASLSPSARSDESLTATLKSLALDDGEKNIDRGRERTERVIDSGAAGDVGSAALPALGSGVEASTRPSQVVKEEEISGRRSSKPINIGAPRHRPAVYTPLSARGDQPGGYFPNHETLQRQYKTHPFFKKPESTPSSPIMSNGSSALSSPSATTPRATQSMASPGPSSVPSPEALAIPMGKYHPSNYKPVPASGPTALSPTPHSMLSSELEIPALGKSNKRPAYERRTSDVKRKLQQYQRDMISEARLAGVRNSQDQFGIKPISPKLQPRGSPGPITPFELEESSGYMAAGLSESGKEKQREDVERMIDQEISRKKGGSGSGSPVLRV